MESLLDANAALRYLLEDNQEQAEAVAEAIARGAEVTVEVLAECVYVLAGVYHVPRSRIAESLGILLDEVTHMSAQERCGGRTWALQWQLVRFR